MGVEAPFGLDPHFLFAGPNMAAARHIYDSLINRDELRLRRGVTFHDGAPFTADDVTFSIARVPNIPNNPGPYTSNLRTIARVEVVDAHTVRLHTDRVNPVRPGQLTNIFVVSKRAAAGASTADFASGRAAMGTGPFRLEQTRGSEGMTVLRNDAFWGEKAAYARVTLRVTGNDASRLGALISGDVDLIESVPPPDVVRLQRDARISVFRRKSDRIMYMLPNIRLDRFPLITDAAGQPLPRNPLRDLRVRQALSIAIDRAALVARALDGQGVPAVQMVAEQFGGYDAVHMRVPALAFGQGNRGGFSDARLDGLIAGVIGLAGERREAVLPEVARESLAQLPFIPLYNQVVVVVARRGADYMPRMDEQMVAYHARPAAR